MHLDLLSRYPDTAPKSPPLLFLHGSFTDARVWELNFLPFFADNGYAAHALSLRGHGRSEGHEHLHTWGLADYAADLATAVSTMARPPVLIGHSMGGMVVQKVLERAPDVAGVVLMASVPPQGLLVSNFQMMMRHPFLFQQAALFSFLGPSSGSVSMMRRLLFSPDVSDAKLQGYLDYGQAESQRVVLDMMGLDPLRLDPSKVRAPMLVMGAEQDAFVSPSLVRDTARFYRAECHVFPEMAHAMMLESRWRAVADCLLAWLERTGQVEGA